jgi:DNA invertase Pin-like site-specific DNA recombinase
VTIIGYVRESSFEDPLLQEVALKVWGADIIRAEQRSSARTNPRKELRTILKTISAGDTLMVTRLDRLARDFADLQSIARTLRLKGATLRATEQPIDTGAAAGKTFLDYLNVFAEFDVNLRRERRLEGIVRARAEGRFAGRPATIDPVRIRKMRAQGIKPPSSQRPSASAVRPFTGRSARPSRSLMPNRRWRRCRAPRRLAVPLLRDPQRERFCREVVEQYLAMPPSSAPVQAAYVAAGFRPNRANAHRFAGRPEIRQRIQELMAEALAYADIRIQKAAVTLDHIASARLSDFYEPAAGLKDIASLPPRLAGAIKKVEYYPDGSIKHIELHDKVRALETIMRHLGGMREEGPPVNVAISDEQRIAAVMSLLARAKPELPPGETQ